MSYIRFKRLRKYVNGTPTDEYMKGTERYDLIAYDSYFSCTNGYSQITRWVDTPITECHNGNLCSMKKQQVSYDNGNSWQDTGIIQVKDIIENNARECLAYLEEWRVIPNTFTCENFNKFSVEEEYISYDSGQSWEATGQTRIGQMIEPLSTDCGVLYQWVTVEGQYVCQGTDKYTLQKEQYSIDEGTTWIDTSNTRAGTLIETESEDCGYEPSYIYQWVIVQNEFVCVETSKYQKEKEQRSADGGTTWEDTGNVRAGQLIERQSYECGYISYRWIVDPTTYECVNYDKYAVEKEQQTTDGQTWTDTGRTRTGSLIEHDSTDCGYIPPVPTNIKARLTYLNGDTYDVPLNSSSTLEQTEIRRGISDTTDPHYYKNIVSAVITENVTRIWSSTFYDCSGLTSVTIPSTVTSIDSLAFESCTSLTNVTIPYGVTSIGGSAFSSCSSLTSVTIPDSVTSLGNHAFFNCSALTSVTIPDSVTSIEQGTLYDCSALTSVTIPDSVTLIGSSAFRGCTALTSITIPDSVTSIGSSAFQDCSSLTSIVIPDSVTSIGEQHTFSGCTSLTSLTISDSITSIGFAAFANCTGLTSLTIPDSVTTIGSYAFHNCDGLTSVTFGNGVTSIGEQAFEWCENIINIVLNNGLVSIGNQAFQYCYGLTNITIPLSVTTIGNSAFGSCNGLTSVTIPDGVTSIGNNAFNGCRSLTSVTIGNGVTSIGSGAFNYCYNMAGATCLATTPPTLGTNVFGNSAWYYPIYVPAASVQTYKSASGWSSYSSRIQAISN